MADAAATVLVYSSSAAVRQRVATALGTRPAAGVALSFVDYSLGEDVVRRCDLGDVSLAILDGEAAPTGGMGLCRQLKDELEAPPPVLLLVGRRDDAWLATWSRADAVVPFPLDAVQLAETVLALLGRATAGVASAH